MSSTKILTKLQPGFGEWGRWQTRDSAADGRRGCASQGFLEEVKGQETPLGLEGSPREEGPEMRDFCRR